jgi:hypothetical protein
VWREKRTQKLPKYAKYIYTEHAELRKQQRSISGELIKRVVESFEIEYPQKRGKRKFSKIIDGDKLYVVIREGADGKAAFVITAYWAD